MSEFKSPPSGSLPGTTTGPGSSTDNAITRWDGITGEQLQDSGATLNDSGEITAAGYTDSSLTADRAVISNGSKKLASSSVTSTELAYMSGVTSAVQTQLNTNATAISDHLSDATDAHDASAISSVASGNLAATDVQAALNELQTDIDTRALASDLSNHLSDATDAHDASAISSVASGNLAATDVQAALNELQSDIDTRATTAGTLAQFGSTTSLQLAGVISDETGSGSLVFATSPSLTTPSLGAATATSINSTTIPSSKTLVVTTDKLSALAATTSSELAGVISDETGSGALVFGTSPTLTTPTIDDGLILNHESSVSIPGADKAALFVKNDDKLYITNSSGVTTAVASAGTGEKNYITNPSALSAITGWTAVSHMTVARTTTAADLPREYTTATGIKITATASQTQGTSTYVYYDFTLDDVDLNKKLKIEWSQKQTGSYVASDLAVIITTQADRTTALHTPITTNIPAVDGVFTTSFDSSSTATLSLVIRATTNMADNAGITISDVVVGPGTIVQGAAVSEWQSCTVTGTWVSNTTYSAYERRVGDSAQYYVQVSTSGAPTVTNLAINLPSGRTIDTTKLMTGTTLALGTGSALDGGTRVYPVIPVYQSTTQVRVYCAETTGETSAIVSEDNPFTFGSGDYVTLFFTVPIAEWSGSGTVSLGPGAQVEYASNSSTSATVSDSTSFIYGPNGYAVGSITAGLVRRVRFQYPIQVDDIISVEVSPDADGRWYDIGNGAMQNSTGRDIDQFRKFNSITYGIGAPRIISSTDVDINFGTYRSTADSASWGGIGSAWSGTSTALWRVRKAKASAPVGFGLAGTDGSAGLVNPYTEGSGVVYTGTYTPTITNSSNATSISVSTGAFTYTRVGRVVTVSGLFTAGATTAANTKTIVTITLPIASNLANSHDLTGLVTVDNSGGTLQYSAGFCSGNTGSDNAYCEWAAARTNAQAVVVQFTYKIL